MRMLRLFRNYNSDKGAVVKKLLGAVSFVIFLFLVPVFSQADEGETTIVDSIGGGITNVGNTGSSGIRVPIEVPPGRNGIVPNLNVVYNSSRGYGWLGLG